MGAGDEGSGMVIILRFCCHCQKRSDEAIPIREIASLGSQ
jgi:hypothetical protein